MLILSHLTCFFNILSQNTGKIANCTNEVRKLYYFLQAVIRCAN
nr:MAG TPA: hypothetical protein [Caudoviricetes sp.]